MGNVAAANYGMPEIRFHSGGTDPTAFNPRTVSALKAIGFEIEATGEEANRGEAVAENPIYRVSWGNGLDLLEFSKHYADPSNLQSGFASLVVCGEADSGRPMVRGVAVRISMPFEDSNEFDGELCKMEKYAERRDDIGRLMLSVMVQAHELMTAKEEK